jgi:sodium transport system ATP-binding protein
VRRRLYQLADRHCRPESHRLDAKAQRRKDRKEKVCDVTPPFAVFAVFAVFALKRLWPKALAVMARTLSLDAAKAAQPAPRAHHFRRFANPAAPAISQFGDLCYKASAGIALLARRASSLRILMIQVRDLSKSYSDLRRGSFVALDRVSFAARPGEIFGLLGPNGAGKTTLLRILSTVLRPTGGHARVAGYDVLTQPDLVRRHIGFVSTNTAVYDRMTAWEMVEYFGRLYGLPADELRASMEDIFTRLAMNEIRDLLGAKMSTGMKQKVSIARALVHDPPVLIFDEATVGLDVLVARSLLKTIAHLRDEGKCIIFSTHIMREAQRLCDRLAIIYRGRLLAEGTLEELQSAHDEHDLEELFFSLILDQESPMPETIPAQ